MVDKIEKREPEAAKEMQDAAAAWLLEAREYRQRAAAFVAMAERRERWAEQATNIAATHSEPKEEPPKEDHEAAVRG